MDAGLGVEIRLLGGFSVRRAGQEIPASELGGRLGRTLIRILVTRRGTVVPVDVLAEALWPDRQPTDPAANVAVLLSRVRRALGNPGVIAAATGHLQRRLVLQPQNAGAPTSTHDVRMLRSRSSGPPPTRGVGNRSRRRRTPIGPTSTGSDYCEPSSRCSKVEQVRRWR